MGKGPRSNGEVPHSMNLSSRRSLGPYHQAVMRGDEEIRKNISGSLNIDEAVDASMITVEVRDGVVRLTGTVPTLGQKRAAADDAWAIPGVLEVQNRLKVQK